MSGTDPSRPGARGSQLALGYEILLEMWLMENWLSKWNGIGSFTSWYPYRTLTSLADGASGYLRPVLARPPGV